MRKPRESASDWREATKEHIAEVYRRTTWLWMKLMLRGHDHDKSKLEDPEAEIFAQVTSKLAGLTYGSAEYKAALEEMGPALEHHYANNRHHPEYFGDKGIEGMTLIDLAEMLCDWKAATLRHDDGDIMESLRLNQERFKISSQLQQILMNTIVWMEEDYEETPR